MGYRAQKEFINRFDPKDDIDRSYCQYRCQMELSGRCLKLLYNIFSAFLFFIFLLIIREPKKKTEKENNVKALFVFSGDDSIIPMTIRRKYKIVKINKLDFNLYLSKEDKDFIIKIYKRYPFSYFFCFKSMLKIAMYKYQISKHSPKAIIVSSEYSFTSSILTAFCERYGIKHINVMHGEKLFNMRDAFFRFHECYIWNNHYKDLFIELKADPNQFIVEIPEFISSWNNKENIEKTIDYTYYLGDQKKEELKILKEALSILIRKGYKVAIRPHPLDSSMKVIKRYFNYNNGFIVESTQEISIKESLMRTKNAISMYSTVLVQAINNGIDIIIDDISNKIIYEKLRELKYIVFEYNHSLLSDLIYKTEYKILGKY